MSSKLTWKFFLTLILAGVSCGYSQKYKWAYLPIPYIQSLVPVTQSVVKVDNNGVYKIAFAANQHIMYVEFDGTYWKIEIGGDNSYRDSKVDLALDSKSNPHLLYHRGDYEGILYANKNNGSWQSETLARPQNVKTDWYQLSLILNDNDDVFAAYTSPNGEVAEATLFYSIISSTGQITSPSPMVPTGRNGKWNDFIIDNQTGLPVLAFFADHVRKPVISQFKDNEWSIDVIDSLQVSDSTVYDESLYGYGISLAQKKDGSYAITHHDAEAGQNYIYLMEGRDGYWKRETVYTIHHTTWSSENPVAVDSKDSVLVAHNLYDQETSRNNLYLSFRDNGEWAHELVENNSYAGLYPDLTINKYDQPVISYLDSASNLLYLAIAVEETPSREPNASIDESSIVFNHISDSLKINVVNIDFEKVGNLFPLALKKDSTLTRVFLKAIFENQANTTRTYPLKLNPKDTTWTTTLNYNLNTPVKLIIEGDDIYRNKFTSDTLQFVLTDTVYYSKVDTTGPDFTNISFKNIKVSDSLMTIGPLIFPETQSKAPVKSVKYNFLRSFQNGVDTGFFFWDSNENGWMADSIFVGLNNIGLLQVLAQDTLGKITDKWIKICSPWDWPEKESEESRWQMIGVPYDINYGEFKKNLKPSNAAHHFFAISNNDLVEKKFKDKDSIKAGTGLLYGALNGGWGVEGYTQGVSNKAVDTLFLNKGWNLLTMPFPFEVPTSSLQFSRPDQIVMLLQLRYSAPNYVWQASGLTFFPYVGYALYTRLDNQFITFEFSPSIPEKKAALNPPFQIQEKYSGQQVYFSNVYEEVPFLNPIQPNSNLYIEKEAGKWMLVNYQEGVKARLKFVSESQKTLNFGLEGAMAFEKVLLIDLKSGYPVPLNTDISASKEGYLVLAGNEAFINKEGSKLKGKDSFTFPNFPVFLKKGITLLPLNISAGFNNVELNCFIRDVKGRIWFHKSARLPGGLSHLELNMGNAPNGIYIMEIMDVSNTLEYKFKVMLNE